MATVILNTEAINDIKARLLREFGWSNAKVDEKMGECRGSWLIDTKIKWYREVKKELANGAENIACTADRVLGASVFLTGTLAISPCPPCLARGIQCYVYDARFGPLGEGPCAGCLWDGDSNHCRAAKACVSNDMLNVEPGDSYYKHCEYDGKKITVHGFEMSPALVETERLSNTIQRAKILVDVLQKRAEDFADSANAA